MGIGSPSWKNATRSNSERQSQIQSSQKDDDQEAGRDVVRLKQSSSFPHFVVSGQKVSLSGPLQQESPKKVGGDGDRYLCFSCVDLLSFFQTPKVVTLVFLLLKLTLLTNFIAFCIF